ncbi:putative ribonuclease H-like domain-containing protein [Tanacetum coccineum]
MLLQNCHFSSKITEDGNSFKPVARTTTNADGTSTSTIPSAVTAEEKIQKRMILKPEDAKTLFEAIEARFCGNEATRKTQKSLLKHMYENFNAFSSESLDFIFTRLQKIISQLAILDLGSISFDDLYNNFKIVEQEVKRSVTSSSNLSLQNVAFVSTPSSTNDINTSNVHVSTASSSLSTASSTDNTARLSDATIYAFLANQPNGSQVVHEDLEQIHEDDLEEMDLKWQLALLSMKARKFYQRTGKKIIINGSDTAGYDKTKVECFNCHKMGHFARECRNPRSQENRSRNQDSSRRTVNVEESSSKAMLAIDGVGFDWSFMTEEKTPTNFALMAFSDSEVHNNKTCSKTCLKSFEDLKSQYDNLRIELNKSEFDLANYKRGLASVEEQLVFYKKNEAVLTKSGIVPFCTARQRSSKAATPLSAARPINTAAPKLFVNAAKTKPNVFQKAHSLSKRPFNQQTTLNNRSLNNKINTAKINYVNTAKGKRVKSAVGKQGINVVKSSACWVWRPRNIVDHISKNSGSYICKPFDYGDPQVALKDTGIFDSRCSRHMTGNKSFLIDYQNYDGGFVAFAGSSKGGRITGKERKVTQTSLYDKSKLVTSVSQPLQILHMDLFGPTFVKSIMGKAYCLVVTDDYNKFSWVFFLAKNDETSGILKNFITRIKNQLNSKVKIIRCDNRTEFKNYEMNQFCGNKGIKRELSNARTPKQNRVAKRKNMTLIEAARTMLADLLLPITFWAEAVNTACYV